jgi:hypothetical protein
MFNVVTDYPSNMGYGQWECKSKSEIIISFFRHKTGNVSLPANICLSMHKRKAPGMLTGAFGRSVVIVIVDFPLALAVGHSFPP